jgi:hypothetical protein
MKIINGKNTITTEIAYIAGFFDGEGCVRIKKANQGGNSYYLIAHITNTNPIILKKVQDLFGGNTRVQEKGKNKPIYNWCITSSEANDFLKVLSPFLLEKKSQAELGINFHENKEKMSPKDKEKDYKRMMEIKKEIYENPELLLINPS